MGSSKEGQYQYLEKIGEGTYGKVYKGRHKDTHEVIALKKMQLTRSYEGLPTVATREISLLRELDHENIIRLRDVFLDEQVLCLVFEHMECDLKRYLDLNPEALNDLGLVRKLIKQTVRGIDHCHSKGVIHRDLKPQNLLVDPQTGQLKLADFGLAREIRPGYGLLTHEVITLWYRPPEILLGDNLYTLAVDIWSLGCIFAEMLAKKPIFPGNTEVEQINKIMQVLGKPSEEEWPDGLTLPEFVVQMRHTPRRDLLDYIREMNTGTCANAAAISLLDQMLMYRPQDRITASAALQHPFFTS